MTASPDAPDPHGRPAPAVPPGHAEHSERTAPFGQPGPVESGPRTPRRWLRWLARALVALAVCAVVAVWLASLALSHLHHARLKPHVVAAALEYGGVVLDFRVLQVSAWSGTLHAEGLRLAQPERFAGHAPTWLEVGRVDGELDTAEFVDGRVHIRDLHLHDVRLDLVRDARTSTLDELFPSDPDEPTTPTPLSEALGLLRGLGVTVDRVELGLTRAALTEVEGEQLVSRAVLERLNLGGHLHEVDGVLDALLTLRSPEGPRTQLSLMQTESAARDAEGQPLRAGFEGSVELALEVSLAATDGLLLSVSAEAWPGEALLPATNAPLRAELSLGLTFHEDEGRTELDLQVPSVLGGLAQGHITGELGDASPTTLRAANGRVDARFEELPVALAGVSAAGFRGSLVLADATLGTEGIAGGIDLEASLERGALEDGATVGHVEGAHLALETRAVSSQVFNAYAFSLDATRFDYRDGAGEDLWGASGAALALHLTGPTLDTTWVAAADDAAAGSPVGAEAAGGEEGTARGAPTADLLTVRLDELDLQAGSSTLALRTPEARAEGVGLLRATLRGSPLNGEVALDSAELVAHAGRDRVTATPLHARVGLHGLDLDGHGVFGLGGTLDLTVDANARFASGGQSGDARGLAPRLHIDLDEGSVRGDLGLSALTMRERGEPSVALRGLALSVHGEDLESLAPPRARGALRLEGHIAHVEAQGTSVDLPRVRVDLRGAAGAYVLNVDGRIRDLSSSGESLPGSHPLRVRGNADLRAHVYDLDARVGASALGRDDSGAASERDGGDAWGPQSEQRGHDEQDADDPAAIDLQVALHAALAPDGRSVEHRVEGSARHLAALLRPYLDSDTDVRFEEVRWSGEGTLADVLSAPARPGRVPALSADLAGATSGAQHFALDVAALRYATADGLVVTADTAHLEARTQQREGVTLVGLTSALPAVTVVDGQKRADITDLSGSVQLTVPDMDHLDTAQASVDVRVGQVSQTFVDGYPMADLHLVAQLDVNPASATLTSLLLENPAGRTRVELEGTYEGAPRDVTAGRRAHAAAAIYGREALGVSGAIEQDLSAFSGTGFGRRAQGTLRVPFVLESGDLSTFRVRARLVARDVVYVDVSSGVAIEGLEGDVPIVEVVTLTRDGYSIQPSPRTNPLSESRFPDVQPFLDRDAFLSVRRIVLADQVLGPLAGNLRFEGTTVALDRLQFGYRGGVVTAQLQADLRPRAAYATMRGNATGVRGRQQDDILDANFALRFAPATLALDGSLQLVRMSRSHVEGILDVVDPYREDTDMNTVRALLPFGHPRSLQARIQDGLMDLELQLGGIAGIASIQGIRAIPIAPLLDDYVAPIVDRLFREPDADVQVRPNAAPNETPDVPNDPAVSAVPNAPEAPEPPHDAR